MRMIIFVLKLTLSSSFETNEYQKQENQSLYIVLEQSCQVPRQSKKLGAWGHDILEF